MTSPDLLPPGYRRPSRWRHARTLAEAPLRRPALVLVPALLGLSLALVLAFLVAPRFRASAVLRATWESDSDDVARRLAANLEQRRFQALKQQILEPATLDAVADEMRAGSGGATERSPVRGGELLESVAVTQRGGGELVIESVRADPTEAAFVANRLASRLVEETESRLERRQQADPALLEARVAEAERRMEQKGSELRRLQQAAATPPPTEDAAARERLLAERQTIALDLSGARARAEQLRVVRQAAEPAEAPSPAGGEPAELATLRGQLEELEKRYTDEHPDVVALRLRIQRLERVTPPTAPAPAPASGPGPAEEAELARTEQQIKELEGRQAAVDAEIARLAASREGAQPTAGLEALAREYEAARQAYRSLQDQWTAAETASRLRRAATARVEVLRRAEPPPRPFYPSRTAFALTGLALGLAIGLAAASLLELRDRSVKGPDDLAELLPQPLLATIPLVRVRRRGRRR